MRRYLDFFLKDQKWRSIFLENQVSLALTLFVYKKPENMVLLSDLSPVDVWEPVEQHVELITSD